MKIPFIIDGHHFESIYFSHVNCFIKLGLRTLFFVYKRYLLQNTVTSPPPPSYWEEVPVVPVNLQLFSNFAVLQGQRDITGILIGNLSCEIWQNWQDKQLQVCLENYLRIWIVLSLCPQVSVIAIGVKCGMKCSLNSFLVLGLEREIPDLMGFTSQRMNE